MMTADLAVLRQRAQLLSARIATCQDPYLRENLTADLQQIEAQIQALAESAA